MTKYHKFDNEAGVSFKRLNQKDCPSLNEPNLMEMYCIQAHKCNIKATKYGTVVEMFSYGIFVFIIVRLVTLLITAYLCTTMESMLLPPSHDGQSAIPKYNTGAFMVEVVIVVLLVIQSVFALRTTVYQASSGIWRLTTLSIILVCIH